MDRKVELLHKIAAIRNRVDTAKTFCGRENDTIRILPISKYHPVSDIRCLAELGIRDFGENIHQSAIQKIHEFDNTPGEFNLPRNIRWHMVGQIQSNKAKAISQWASSVHSVDRLKVVHALDRGAVQALDEHRRSMPLHVYLQLSLDDDPSRGGASVTTILPLAQAVTEKSGLKLEGLMAVPPISAEIEKAFAEAAEFRQRFLREFPQAIEFSAGMSDDLEIAIAYGSTCLRVGTAIFGPRTLTFSEEEGA